MTPLNASVQRYRRTDQARQGEWAPVGASWKTTASAGLVAHDVYHHLPQDVGTFAQEVAALGAEWYIDVQRVSDQPVASIEGWPLSGFERNVMDTVENALDSREAQAFALPLREAQPLSASEMAFFSELAQKVHATLAARGSPAGFDPQGFQHQFVQMLAWGYRQAQQRFPSQELVRRSSRQLVSALVNLEQSDVPYGHEITISLQGYECAITYTDADAEFLLENEVVPALLMTWCTCASGYPYSHVTLHSSERGYAEHASEHLEAQDAQALSEEQRVIPEGDSQALRPVYIRDTYVQAELRDKGVVALPLSRMHLSDFTPRGVRII